MIGAPSRFSTAIGSTGTGGDSHESSDVAPEPSAKVPRAARETWWILVPALVFGVWSAAGAQHGTEEEVIVFAVLLSIVAIASKQVCALGVFKRGLNRRVVGIGMIPRGEVGLIFASIGHTVLVAGTPVLGDATFSAIIAMVMLTTLVTPPLLKAAFSKLSEHSGRHGVDR